MDLEDTKNKLQAVLKTSFDAYWDGLRKFIRGKSSKAELDSVVRSLLGDAHRMYISLSYSIFNIIFMIIFLIFSCLCNSVTA